MGLPARRRREHLLRYLFGLQTRPLDESSGRLDRALVATSRFDETGLEEPGHRDYHLHAVFAVFLHQ